MEANEVRNVAEVGWLAIADRELIKLMQARFDVFITLDQGFAHQQNLANCSFGIVILHVRKNTLKFYEPIFNLILAAAETVAAGQVVHMAARAQLVRRRIPPVTHPAVSYPGRGVPEHMPQSHPQPLAE
jgi:hypothetical protein